MGVNDVGDTSLRELIRRLEAHGIKPLELTLGINGGSEFSLLMSKDGSQRGLGAPFGMSLTDYVAECAAMFALKGAN